MPPSAVMQKPTFLSRRIEHAQSRGSDVERGPPFTDSAGRRIVEWLVFAGGAASGGASGGGTSPTMGHTSSPLPSSPQYWGVWGRKFFPECAFRSRVVSPVCAHGTLAGSALELSAGGQEPNFGLCVLDTSRKTICRRPCDSSSRTRSVWGLNRRPPRRPGHHLESPHCLEGAFL